jgi:hypothetical protein
VHRFVIYLALNKRQRFFMPKEACYSAAAHTVAFAKPDSMRIGQIGKGAV